MIFELGDSNASSDEVSSIPFTNVASTSGLLTPESLALRSFSSSELGSGEVTTLLLQYSRVLDRLSRMS